MPDLRPSDIVVIDNLSAPKVAGIQAAIKQAGAKVKYLPPSSPDYNPIEHVFAKLTAMLRKTQARTVDALGASLADCWTGLAVLSASATFATAAVAGQGETALQT